MGRRFILCFGAVAEQLEEEKKKKQQMATKEQLPLQQTTQLPPPPPPPQPQQQELQVLLHNSATHSFTSTMSKEEDEEMTRSALSTFRAKEEEIEKRKMEVRERVLLQLGRVEEETKRLAIIREELETLADPLGKDLTATRKRIDTVNKELVTLGQSCQKKEREYKEAVEALNEKNREKVQLVTKLKELVNESENWRMKKLEELSKNLL